MLFSTLQKAFFNASDGAYSIVTDDERFNSQITLTDSDGESQIAISHYESKGIEIPRLKTAGRKLPICIWGNEVSTSESQLAVNYPKPTGNELRIYRNVRQGFSYESGDVWFIYRSEGRLFVGSMPVAQWRSIGTRDENDSAFQETIEHDSSSSIPDLIDYSGQRIPRDPAIAREAISRSQHLCAYTGKPTPFTSRRTGYPYLEAHHLIPLGLQSQFDFRLDCVENIVALNPLWHRAIHHAVPPTVSEIVTRLAERRAAFLGHHGLSPADLIRLYGCEEIA
ncbi:HNH endonuclease [Pelagicoccus albus]|uniref:HNH endonuclease n=1 Tax=Pelagicoccus albus TaxID=415222 RepID=A0A7X1BAL7_9BACT|nr:hypothetical protein [Pelagicoccus albus]MBC2607498.1 hypothetical protein [Pelagicoccus albus]